MNVAEEAITMRKVMVTGFIMGVLLVASCYSAAVEHRSTVDHETNPNVLTDTADENVVRYHAVRGDTEWWTVEDVERGLKVSKVRNGNNEYKCVVSNLKDLEPAQQSARRGETPQIGNDSDPAVAPLTSVQIMDSSLLGEKAAALCSGIPVYYDTYSTPDKVTTADLPAGKKLRNKRSVDGICNGEYRRNIVTNCWSGCTKTCGWYNSYGQYRSDTYTYRAGNFNYAQRQWVPGYCGGDWNYQPPLCY